MRLHPQEAKLQAARAWQRSPEFDDFRKQRQVVEHRIARLVQLGIRQARYLGRRKTLFQVLIAATVANLTLAASQAAHQAPTIGTQALFGAIGAVLQRRCRPIQSLHRFATGLAAITTHPARRADRLLRMAVFRPRL